MAEGLNRVTLLGNLGSDAELKQAGSSSVLKLRLATTERYVDKDGEKQERCEWHNVNIWGKRAEALAKHLKKGDRILVEGSLRYGSYEKDGVKHYTTDINASNIVFAGGGNARPTSSTSAVYDAGAVGGDNPPDEEVQF